MFLTRVFKFDTYSRACEDLFHPTLSFHIRHISESGPVLVARVPQIQTGVNLFTSQLLFLCLPSFPYPSFHLLLLELMSV